MDIRQRGRADLNEGVKEFISMGKDFGFKYRRQIGFLSQMAGAFIIFIYIK
jgi:hypothetical protein